MLFMIGMILKFNHIRCSSLSMDVERCMVNYYEFRYPFF